MTQLSLEGDRERRYLNKRKTARRQPLPQHGPLTLELDFDVGGAAEWGTGPRTSSVRRRLCSACQREISSWLPLSKTGGTSIPRNSRGRVNWGCSSSPASTNESYLQLVSSPRTPGTWRMTVSITSIAGTSPPLVTKSPTEISKGDSPVRIRSSNPSYRPHNSSSRSWAASAVTNSWSRRRPCGVSITSRPGLGPSACTALTQSNTG